jgi:ubiquinone/menaquinone biosynthesis C-methylase UbiE
MADARDVVVWTNHAKEQMKDNPNPHNMNGYICRQWITEYLPEGSETLDLGCGSGLWTHLFDGYKHIGIDQNRAMIAAAKIRFPDRKRSFLVVSWNKYPFRDNRFDLVWTAAVIQHNLHEQKKSIFTELARIIKPGGYYMCTENTFREDNYKTSFPHKDAWSNDLDDGYSLTMNGWKNFIEPFGFQLLKFQLPSEYLYQRI